MKLQTASLQHKASACARALRRARSVPVIPRAVKIKKRFLADGVTLLHYLQQRVKKKKKKKKKKKMNKKKKKNTTGGRTMSKGLNMRQSGSIMMITSALGCAF